MVTACINRKFIGDFVQGKDVEFVDLLVKETCEQNVNELINDEVDGGKKQFSHELCFPQRPLVISESAWTNNKIK